MLGGIVAQMGRLAHKSMAAFLIWFSVTIVIYVTVAGEFFAPACNILLIPVPALAAFGSSLTRYVISTNYTSK